jgi:hypothetical protein
MTATGPGRVAHLHLLDRTAEERVSNLSGPAITRLQAEEAGTDGGDPLAL